MQCTIAGIKAETEAEIWILYHLNNAVGICLGLKRKIPRLRFWFDNIFFLRDTALGKNDKRYPGKPDVVLPKYKTVIFVNGCFWHMHKNCKYGRIPKSNVDYWKPKLERNVQNDKKHYKELGEEGWRVIVLWECELKKDFDAIMEKTIESFDPL